MKVLIVEDEFIQRKYLSTLLTKAGHEVVEAANGQAAWEHLQAEPERMVITDWIMPTMDGLELVRLIRAADFPHYTYILLLTAREGKEDVVAGLEAGADDYLTKPFDQAELVARLGIGERILNLEARLQELATHDGLTGLLNRRALYEIAGAELNRAARNAGSASLILLDIDHFKRVNDKFGHMVGDQVLCMVARVLLSNQRGYDFIARWGGEEFLALLPQTAQDQAMQVAERLRAELAAARLSLPDGREVHITVSMGVSSTSTKGPNNLDTLLQQADEALYAAKSAGRNRVCRFGG